MEIQTQTVATNTNPLSQIALINKETKKKPYDVKIKNFNPNEPKIEVNMKYSDKQRYRRYKTKTEPKLNSKIMIDEEDDIVKTIKKAFGIQDKTKKNYSEVETSGTPYYQTPEPQQPETQEIYDAPRREQAPTAAAEVRQRARRPMEVAQPQIRQSIVSEITRDLAQPSQLSPGKMIAQMALKEAEERRKKREQAEAEDRKKAAEAAAEARKRVEEEEKQRLLELSKIAITEQEKSRALTLEEQTELERKKIKQMRDDETKYWNDIRKRKEKEQQEYEELLKKKKRERTKDEKEFILMMQERNQKTIARRKAFNEHLQAFVGLTQRELDVFEEFLFRYNQMPTVERYGRTPEERKELMFWKEIFDD